MTQPIPAAAPRRPRPRICALVGCLVLLALLAIPSAVLWALLTAVRRAPAARMAHRRIEHALPATGGTVVLDVAMAELEVVSAPAGSPLRLDADWDEAGFRLEEGMTTGSGGWSYHLRFRGRPLAMFGRHPEPNRLRLTLPAGSPLALEGRVAMGKSEVALGGLELTRAALSLTTGEHRVSFSTPTTGPLDLLRVDGAMGELTILGVGNASPRRVVTRHRMGDLTLDLSGPWRADADVEVRIGMGDCRVLLPRPDEAASIVESARMVLGEGRVHSTRGGLPPGLPRLHVQASGAMGDLEVQ